MLYYLVDIYEYINYELYIYICILVSYFMYCPRDPITLSKDEQGVYNHLRNERYLGSITILRR